jgi:hypothetical protein
MRQVPMASAACRVRRGGVPEQGASKVTAAMCAGDVKTV